jgi:hypothetical protein
MRRSSPGWAPSDRDIAALKATCHAVPGRSGGAVGAGRSAVRRTMFVGSVRTGVIVITRHQYSCLPMGFSSVFVYSSKVLVDAVRSWIAEQAVDAVAA